MRITHVTLLISGVRARGCALSPAYFPSFWLMVPRAQERASRGPLASLKRGKNALRNVNYAFVAPNFVRGIARNRLPMRVDSDRDLTGTQLVFVAIPVDFESGNLHERGNSLAMFLHVQGVVQEVGSWAYKCGCSSRKAICIEKTEVSVRSEKIRTVIPRVALLGTWIWSSRFWKFVQTGTKARFLFWKQVSVSLFW